MPQAQGAFTVKTAPLPTDEAIASTSIGRYSLDKQYTGDLVGASAGEMLGAGNPATGTAGYVAIEEVNGALRGLNGTFALQHYGTMQAGNFSLNVQVVPGSGTGALEGISGSLTILIEAGKHSYIFEYSLPASA